MTVRAEFFERGGQVRIGAVASREEDGFVTELQREFFGESQAEVRFCDVRDVKAGLRGGFVCCAGRRRRLKGGSTGGECLSSYWQRVVRQTARRWRW